MATGTECIHWYGLKVFFNKVFEIETLLSADGVESYIPCEIVTVEVRGVRKQVRRTVIPSLMVPSALRKNMPRTCKRHCGDV